MHGEVTDALSRVADDDAVRVLVLTGAGRGFCAGQDLSDRAVAGGEAVDLGDSVERYYAPLIRRLATLYREGLAAFMEKRKPIFVGRSAAGPRGDI